MTETTDDMHRVYRWHEGRRLKREIVIEMAIRDSQTPEVAYETAREQLQGDLPSWEELHG